MTTTRTAALNSRAAQDERTLADAIDLIGKPWDTCINEACRNCARRIMVVLIARGETNPAALAVQGLRAINVTARAGHGRDGQLVVPSDQWAKAYAVPY